MKEEFDIRYSEADDLVYLKQWFETPGACDDFPFEETEMHDALVNWIGFAKFKASLTSLIQDTPCAIGTLFLMPYRKVAHHCSFYLMVDPVHRRKGYGTTLVRNLLHLAKTRFRLESVHVEIYEGCPLEPLLKKLSFTLLARQENFVHLHGPKARLLYEKPL